MVAHGRMQVSGEECFGSRIGSYQGSLKDKLTTPGWVNLCIRLCTEKVSCSLQTVTLFREEASKEAEDPMQSLVRWLQIFYFRVLGIKWSEFKTESNGLNTAKKMFLIVILSKDLSHRNIFFILARFTLNITNLPLQSFMDFGFTSSNAQF